jgi:hypothetical protein
LLIYRPMPTHDFHAHRLKPLHGAQRAL